MKKIKSLEHAQEVLGVTLNMESFKLLSIPAKDIKPLALQYEIWFITEANNKLNNWKVRSGDPNQEKHSVWAPDIIENKERPAGLGLAFDRTSCWDTRADCGARLEVGTAEEARYIFEDFIEKWDFVWLIQEE